MDIFKMNFKFKHDPIQNFMLYNMWMFRSLIRNDVWRIIRILNTLRIVLWKLQQEMFNDFFIMSK